MNKILDMINKEYHLGDSVHIWLHNHSGKTTEGKIVHKFKLYGHWLYVIEIETYIEPIYECRSAGLEIHDHPIGHEPELTSDEIHQAILTYAERGYINTRCSCGEIVGSEACRSNHYLVR